MILSTIFRAEPIIRVGSDHTSLSLSRSRLVFDVVCGNPFWIREEDIQLRSVEGYIDLKRFLSILSDLIFESRVEPGIPSLTAAPEGPDTLPLLSSSAASIISFSREASFRDSSGRPSSGPPFRSLARGCRDSQLSSTVKFSVSHTIADRSMTFCSSRIFPGQGYD